jgi:hypothetical protein
MGSSSIYSILALLIMAGIVYMVVRVVMGLFGVRTGPELVCTTCGHVGKAKERVRGSIFIEIVLWVCFIIPGVIYSIWRLTTRAKVCTSCGATTLVPTNSPIGRKLIAEVSSSSKG